MRRLIPDPSDLDLDDLYAGLVLPTPIDGQRPWVALGMVSSADGAVTVDGTSGGLGGDADHRAFRRLRAAADAIVVGAGTVRAEGYGPPRAPAARVADRRAAGLAPAPQLVVISGSGALDPDARLFRAERDAGVPPPVVVVGAAAPHERVEALRRVVEVVVQDARDLDLEAVLTWCAARGHTRLLVEGGPSLNGALLAAGLVDELFLTLAPQLVGGDADRIVTGAALGSLPLRLHELHEHEGELLLRYRVEPGRPAAGEDPTRC